MAASMGHYSERCAKAVAADELTEGMRQGNLLALDATYHES